MDMATFKTLEFTAIFGALGWYWWNQRQARLRSDQAQREEPKTQTSETEEDSEAR